MSKRDSLGVSSQIILHDTVILLYVGVVGTGEQIIDIGVNIKSYPTPPVEF